jgi:hypothetical protein
VTELVIPSPGAANNAGRVDVFSGASGLPIPHLALSGAVPGGRFGHAIADAGDLDHDGTTDLVIGSPGPGTTAGRVYLFSGRTGTLIRRIDGAAAADGFGFAVSGAGDLNHDGCAEIVVGATGQDSGGNGAGRVYVFSGIDGSLLRTHDGEAAGDRLGCGVTSVGDIDGDAVPDYAAAANLAGAGHHGRAYVWSGAGGQRLLTLEADPTGSKFGEFFIGPAGDADHDGTPDLYVGDYQDSRAYVFSGTDGHRLYTFHQAPGEGLGCGRTSGDVNGDRHADLVVGAFSNSAGAGQAGRVYVYSGRDGAVLRTITSTRSGEQFGFDAVGVGDLDGDGKLDFLVGASNGNRAYAIAGNHPVCYANCDGGTAPPILNVNDFICFQSRFAAGDNDANCDQSTAPPVLNVNDFLCFQAGFASGCPS